ncbi:TPA: hypothetical protein ACMDWD_003361 [Vibrio cholerae]
MTLTKKMIIKAAIKSTGIRLEYIELVKFEGEYHWGGKAGAVFDEMNTYYKKLDDVPLERWINDLESKIASVLETSNFKHINDYIESVDWDS